MISELKMTTGLTRAEATALRFLVRRLNIEKPIVVDVGTWLGFSCAILASEVQQLGGQVIAVDHWQGNEGTWNMEVLEKKNIYDDFMHNMGVLGFTEIVKVLSMTSKHAMRTVEDKSLSLVFLDADHRYTYIKEDIEGWWEKLKVGGILCGHDCEANYSALSEGARKFISEYLEEDYIEEIGIHGGVVRAVYDCFGNSFSIVDGTRIWFKEKQMVILGGAK